MGLYKEANYFLEELAKRKNMAPYWKSNLEHMKGYVRNKGVAMKEIEG